MIVKICGLKNLADSMATCEAGADMLGFNFYNASPRYIEQVACTEIVQQIKKSFPNVSCVGIFVNHDVGTVKAILSETGLDLAQISGDEPPEFSMELKDRGIMVIRKPAFDDVASLFTKIYKRNTPPAFLLDTYKKGSFGGTGETGDWEIAAEISGKYPIMLAGGLNPANIADAVSKVNPWGVDVASGVESSRGVKDKELISEFIKMARSAAVQAAG